MKILIDIGHPAHVHYFKNLYWMFISEGDQVFFTSREKEITLELLKSYKIPFFNRGKGGNGIIGKFFYIFKGDYLLLKYAIKIKPDIFISFSSPYAAQTAFLLNKPHIALDDTEYTKFIPFAYRPFSKKIITPISFKRNIGNKQIRLKGTMDLLYLHPNYFSPDTSILNGLNLDEKKKNILVRFTGWGATHDLGLSGLNEEEKIEYILKLSDKSNILISSEKQLPEELKKFEIKLPVNKIHDLAASCDIYWGESGTMASECAVLGIPSILINKYAKYYGVFNYLRDQYELLYYFDKVEDSYNKLIDILNDCDSKNKWIEKRDKYIAESDDFNIFIFNLVKKLKD